MEERSNSKDKVTKTGNFSWRTIRKLVNNKIIYRKSKESHKEAIQQEKIKLSDVEVRRQHVAGRKNIQSK